MIIAKFSTFTFKPVKLSSCKAIYETKSNLALTQQEFSFSTYSYLNCLLAHRSKSDSTFLAQIKTELEAH